MLLGIALQTAIFLLGGFAMVVRTDAHTNMMKEEIVAMRKELHKLAEVITIQAVQTTRIDNLYSQVTLIQQAVEALRHGDGFIRQRKGVNGEYP